jgi:cell division protein FtsQ
VSERRRPRREHAQSVVVPFPRKTSSETRSVDLGRLLPSARSLLVGFAVLGSVLVALVVARETPLFGVRKIDVTGAPPGVQRQVERTLASRRGHSLVELDLDAATRDVVALPTVAGVTFDRAYPNTLRVTVVPERAVAVVRQGAAAFVVSERGRVVARVPRSKRPELARIWAAQDLPLEPGAIVDGDLRTAVGAVAPLAGVRFPGRVVSVVTEEDQLTLRLRTGLELRLGEPTHVDLKLAVAGRVLPLLPAGSGYLDLSVPDRPVAGPPTLDSQVEVESSTSSTP